MASWNELLQKTPDAKFEDINNADPSYQFTAEGRAHEQNQRRNAIISTYGTQYLSQDQQQAFTAADWQAGGRFTSGQGAYQPLLNAKPTSPAPAATGSIGSATATAGGNVSAGIAGGSRPEPWRVDGGGMSAGAFGGAVSAQAGSLASAIPKPTTAATPMPKPNPAQPTAQPNAAVPSAGPRPDGTYPNSATRNNGTGAISSWVSTLSPDHFANSSAGFFRAAFERGLTAEEIAQNWGYNPDDVAKSAAEVGITLGRATKGWTPGTPANAGPGMRDPAPWEVARQQTVAGQLEDLMRNDSPLMQQARARAQQRAVAMGLENSSLAASAGEAAMLDQAMQVAGADANTYARSGEFNATQRTAFARDANNFDREMDMARFNRDLEDRRLAADISYREAQLADARDARRETREMDGRKLNANARQFISTTVREANTTIANIEANPNMSREAKRAAIQNIAISSQRTIDSYAASEGLEAPNAWPELTGKTGTSSAYSGTSSTTAGRRTSAGGDSGAEYDGDGGDGGFTPDGREAPSTDFAEFWTQGYDPENARMLLSVTTPGMAAGVGSDENFAEWAATDAGRSEIGFGSASILGESGQSPYPEDWTRDDVARYQLAQQIRGYVRATGDKSPFRGGNAQSFVAWVLEQRTANGGRGSWGGGGPGATGGDGGGNDNGNATD